jgi:hypothetical protein
VHSPDRIDDEWRNDRHPQWRHLFLAAASLLLIASCSVGVKFGTGENEPPATLYIFNLNPPAGDVFVYEEVLKPESFEKAKEMLSGGSPYALRQVAIVSGQRYARISLRPRLITLRMAATPVSSEGQKNFHRHHPGPDGYLERFDVNADSGGTYYAVVYSRSASEALFNLFTGPLLEATGLGILRESKWQGLGDVRGDPIPSDKGQELLARLKPQESAAPQQKPLDSPPLPR